MAVPMSCVLAFADDPSKESESARQGAAGSLQAVPKRGFFDPRSVLRLGEEQPSLLCVVQHRGIMVQFPKDEKEISIPVTTVEAGKIIGASSGESLGSPSARTRPLRIGETGSRAVERAA
jgi:hypothetical protein